MGRINDLGFWDARPSSVVLRKFRPLNYCFTLFAPEAPPPVMSAVSRPPLAKLTAASRLRGVAMA